MKIELNPKVLKAMTVFCSTNEKHGVFQCLCFTKDAIYVSDSYRIVKYTYTEEEKKEFAEIDTPVLFKYDEFKTAKDDYTEYTQEGNCHYPLESADEMFERAKSQEPGRATYASSYLFDFFNALKTIHGKRALEINRVDITMSNEKKPALFEAESSDTVGELSMLVMPVLKD